MFKAGLLIILVGVVIADSQFVQIPMLLLLFGAFLTMKGARNEKSNND